MTVGPARSGDESEEPFQLACRYLANRERCGAEVRAYLRRKGYAKEAIERAIGRLIERKYVDDLRYARLYVQVRSRNAPRSAAYLRKELIGRGVDRETARRAVEEYIEEVPEEELARRVLEKLPGQGREWRERAARRLRARGFRASMALRCLPGSPTRDGEGRRLEDDSSGHDPFDEEED